MIDALRLLFDLVSEFNVNFSATDNRTENVQSEYYP